MPSESVAKPTAPSPGHTKKGRTVEEEPRQSQPQRTVSTPIVSIGLTLMTTAAPALAAGNSWAG